jgi:hypothetical protein
MNKKIAMRPLTDRDRAAWRKHNLETLAESVALPFGEKVAILEDLEQITIALGYRRDPATGRLYKSRPEKADL